ncbi:16606_t:CDS:2 [Acaulospora morrowiae]|uniref:16606_t:CDS:1 n=1 Tax=Acaulospora morrowiae TaxID=94023 RepID=A0A9N8VH28_9GLOM|nr:16606_t:CDS:2 [Acaulospora morrowiae]
MSNYVKTLINKLGFYQTKGKHKVTADYAESSKRKENIMTSQQEPQQQPRVQSFEGHRFSGQDGGVNIEANLQQLINERNLLRSQNDQLWKIIERQKTVITNLQKDNQKLGYERDRLITRLRELDSGFNRLEDGSTSVRGGSIDGKTVTDSAILVQQLGIDTARVPPEIGNSINQSKPSSQQKPIRTQEPKRTPLISEAESLTSKQSSLVTRQPNQEALQQETTVSSTVTYDEPDIQYLPPVVVSEPSPVKLNDSSVDNSVSQAHDLEQTSQTLKKRQGSQPSLQDPPSPSMSINSLESGSISSNGISQHRRQSTPQTIDTGLDSPTIIRRNSETNNSISLPNSPRKFPSPLEPISKTSFPPRSPGLPSSPKAFLHGIDLTKLSQRDSEEQLKDSHSQVVNVNTDSLNASDQSSEKSYPVRSQSYPQNNEKSSSVLGNDSMDNLKPQRDSITHNLSDPSLGNTFLGSDTIPKEKSLRTSKSFGHIPQSSQTSISVTPSENRDSALGNNTLFIPGNQGKRHSVFMQPSRSQVDSPAVEHVSQHIKNKGSFSDASVVTDPSYGQISQHQTSQSQQSNSASQQSNSASQQSQSPPPSKMPSKISSETISGIAVKVIGSNKKINDKGKEVLTFILSVGQARVVDGTIVGMEKELWRVEKFYSDFLALDGKLKQQSKRVANMMKKLPDKNLLYNNAPSKVDQRKTALEQYLQHIISLPLKDSKDLCEFLSANVIEQDSKDLQQPGFKEGYLTKKGKNFGGWKTRFFVLDSPVLKYYESKDGNHLGSIRLTHAQIGRQQSNTANDSEKDNENSYRHAFLILEPKPGSKTQNTRHVLCAESDAERDEWVEALLQYVGVAEESSKQKKDKKKTNTQTVSEQSSRENSLKNDSRHERKKGNNDSISSTNSSMLSVSNHNVGALNGREDIDRPIIRNGTPELREPLLVSSVVSSSSQSSRDAQSHGQLNVRRDRLQEDDQPSSEKKKNSRKTFFGNMFSSNRDEKKRYHDARPDTSRIVFGVPLDQAISVVRIKEGYELPAVVYRCIEYLDAKNASEEEGIYRLNGATATIKSLKDRFNTEGDVDLVSEGGYDVHAVAGLLKLYLRELPTSVLTRELHMEFLNVIDLLDRRDRVNELGRLVSTLPLPNYTLLRTLARHLIQIVQKSDINKMTVRNIGIVFAPSLGIPAGVFTLLMAEFDYIFFTDSDGSAAPKTLEEAPKGPENQHSTSDLTLNSKNPTPDTESSQKIRDDPEGDSTLSPTAAFRRRDIRNELNGRSNRNSVHYMDSAPEIVVGLERKLTASKSTFSRNDSSDDEVNDLALQIEDDVESISSVSADDLNTLSPPISVPASPRSIPAPPPRSNSLLEDGKSESEPQSSLVDR